LPLGLGGSSLELPVLKNSVITRGRPDPCSGGMKMRQKSITNSLGMRPYLWRVTVIMVACTLIYYLPIIAGLIGGVAVQDMLNLPHNFYGIDFYALVFFGPVVYAAYVLGVRSAVVAAIAAALLLIPYSLWIDLYPNVLFKPTAFAIILSAVGAVVAMLQKSDEQKRRYVRELKCLYGIGKVAEESGSLDKFLSSAVALISEAMRTPGDNKVRVVVRDEVFQSPDFEQSADMVREDLLVGGEVLGSIEIHSLRNRSGLKESDHLIRTLAERISSAIHQIELEQSLRIYYEQLEDIVEKRTRDLEEAKEKLIRSERLAAVGELASGVGHELRNPLNVIRNCAYLLHMAIAERGNSEEDLNTLKLLDRQIDIANRIVTDLLDFTRIKPPSRKRVDLNALVRESLSWVQMPEGMKVTADLNGDTARVKIDAEQVGRAFANIISNAVQAMNGKGELKIDAGTADDLAWVAFRDNGCGIPEENLEKIFEPLFTTKPKGIGLGLAISKRLVEQNSGTIDVASQVKKGTTFTVRLPVMK